MPEVIIADDHFTVRIGVELVVRELLGQYCRIDFAADGDTLLDKISAKKYDLMITDLNMPRENGFKLLSRALELQGDLKIIVLTVHQEVYYVKQCLVAGAYAYVHKSALDHELKEAIRSVSNNKKYISDLQKEQLVQSIISDKGVPEDRFSLLSEREKEAARLLLKGMGVLEVANTLAISQSTASTFKLRIFKKLAVNSIVELNTAALRFGFTTDESIQY